MKPLSSVSEADYGMLKSMGYLYEIYPEATGDWAYDTKKPEPTVPKTNVYKVTLCVMDLNGDVPDMPAVISALENLPHPEFATVVDIQQRQVEWHDNHPLNLPGAFRSTFDNLFASPPAP